MDPHSLWVQFCPRHVGLLQTQLTKMDEEYDKLNHVLATGELNGYGATFLNYISAYFEQA
jgi:hypothetical protein